jgi:enterochelin esterase-like enzyme
MKPVLAMRDRPAKPGQPRMTRLPGVERGPARDRLAVWTYVEHGEEIACGDPSVTDAERAAAGRETLAGRWQALLPGNRSRAAAQYSAGLPDGEDMARVWRPRDPAALRARLGEAPLVAWAEDDILHVLWHGTADEVMLGAGVQPRLWPVEGAGDLWEVSVRIRRLDEAVISIVAMPRRAGDDQPGWMPYQPDQLVWRGPRAATLPTGQPPAGPLDEHTLHSAALGGPRQVTVYRPPGAAGPLPGCVLADGQSVSGFAQVLEPAILAGDVPPFLLVGVHSAADPARPWPDRRGQEYLPGRSPRFRAHLDFVTGEVIPWAAGQFGAADGPWVSAGFSNGGVWAIAAAQRRPDVFTAVTAFSAGVVPRQITGRARAARVRHYLAAGTLEAGFRSATRQWAERLQRAGLPCCYQEWVGGHDPFWWNQQLPAALAWLLSP